jgi:hypothetical protein
MGSMSYEAPWHRHSFDRFMRELLPSLLSERLPLTGYEVADDGPHACRVRTAVGEGVEADCRDVPCVRPDGSFCLDDEEYVVLPVADREELDRAEVRCVGEQLLDYVRERLDETAAGPPQSPDSLRDWLPLGQWVRRFLAESPAAMRLDARNWLARRTHLRRILIPDRREPVAPGQTGRVCPFETPEGANIGRILTVAVGAELAGGRLVIRDDAPAAGLALSASMIPFLEHSDPNRLLMGCNMTRQWLVPTEQEAALVRTGNEPEEPGFWCGRNLLTAFVSLGAETCEDALVMSEAAARKLAAPEPLEPGDKLSNRHGQKGVVSRVLPEEEMPSLADGTPVELVCSYVGIHARLNFGQVREAVMGRIARAEGRPAVVPPFEAPGEEDLRRRLRQAGLPEDGMDRLTWEGRELDRRSTVGYVYWGLTYHVARSKLHLGGMLQGTMEFGALADVGAQHITHEYACTQSARHTDYETLAARLSAGPVEHTGAPSPALAALQRRLAAGGVRAEIVDGALAFRFAPPADDALDLAVPVPHPWLPEREMAAVGLVEEPLHPTPAHPWGADTDLEERLGRQLREANDRAGRILASDPPAEFRDEVIGTLRRRVRAYLDALLGARNAEPLRTRDRVVFSARAVLVPAADLGPDQLGVPDEIAWYLFGPLAARSLGQAGAVEQRTDEAAHALDAAMADSWVVLNRAPTMSPASMIAFRPVRVPGRAVRLNLLAARPMNADFDGDAAAVLLPITEGGQREARERLSLAAHLRRDPGLLEKLLPPHEALCGLAGLSLSADGHAELAAMLGAPVPLPDGLLTRRALHDALVPVLAERGPAQTLTLLDTLLRRGFQVAAASGWSIHPFVALQDAPPRPDTDDPDQWRLYFERLQESLAARTDYDDELLGPQFVAVKSGARGSAESLACLAGCWRPVVEDAAGQPFLVTHGQAQGMTAPETQARTASARRVLAQLVAQVADAGAGLCAAVRPEGYSVLERAMRAEHPGIVFAHAAARGETDPLLSAEARLFAGLPPSG